MATNMTQQLAALACLMKAERGETQTRAFYDQWQDDRLVMDKWFGLQIATAAPDKAARIASDLTRHALFDMKNPNRFRAVMGALAGNHAGFHHATGGAYTLLADRLIKLDALNPQTTARMCAAFQTWKRYDLERQALIAAELDRMLAKPDLSRDSREMLERIRNH
jgi:aminopeptidase N